MPSSFGDAIVALTPDLSQESRMFRETANPNLVQRFTRSADDRVLSSVGKETSPSMAAIFNLNSMTGVGILTLPYCVAHAGVLLSTLALLLATVLAYITATFACEVLSIANALNFEKSQTLDIMKDERLRETLHKEHAAAQASGLNFLLSPLMGRRNTLKDFRSEFRAQHPQLVFAIRERVEMGKIGEMVLPGRVGSVLLYVIILVLTYGSMVGVLITTNKSLAHFVRDHLGEAGYRLDLEIVYRCCVLATFGVVLPLCFTDLQKTKNFTLVVMTLRSAAVVLMLAAALVQIRTRWSTLNVQQIPMWNFEHFGAVYSNSIYMYSIHHNLPSVVSPVRPVEKAPLALAQAFFGLFAITLAIALTATLAWVGEVCEGQTLTGDWSQIQPLYNLNFAHLPWCDRGVGAFIVLYPALGVSSVPATAITTRNTLCSVLGVRPPDPTAPFALQNILLLLVVLVPPFSLAALTQDIQAVTKVVGGYAGLTVCLLLPLVLVIRGRRQLWLDVGRGASLRRPLKSSYANTGGYIFVTFVYLVSVAMVTKQLFF